MTEVISFNQGNIFFLEHFKTAFYHQFSTVLCLGVGPHESSPSHVSMSIGVVIVLVLFRQPYRCGILSEASPSFPKDTMSQKTFWSSESSTPPAPSCGKNP